jgi:hypothetical protein
MWETNIINFVQITEHEVYMYAKFKYLDLYKTL